MIEKGTLNLRNATGDVTFSLTATAEPAVPNWLSFTAESEYSTVLARVGVEVEDVVHFYYSYNLKDWKDFNNIEVTLKHIGDTIYVKQTAPYISISVTEVSKFSNFVMTGKIACHGSIMSLLNADPSSVVMQSSCQNGFFNLFRKCASLTTAPELPATTVTSDCYRSMFRDCTSLTAMPELPAETVYSNSYANMFWGCTNLTSIVDLPALNLASNCYASMFRECSSLTTVPKLPAKKLANYCYASMFRDCVVLQDASNIEFTATSVSNYAYSNMFWGCTELTKIPKFTKPLQKVATYSCSSMFRDCVSLNEVPSLAATTLGTYCYSSMFRGCTSLKKITKLPATTLPDSCYANMFRDCPEIYVGTSSSARTYRIPNSGSGSAGTDSMANMFNNTASGSVKTPSINTTYYTNSTIV